MHRRRRRKCAVATERGFALERLERRDLFTASPFNLTIVRQEASSGHHLTIHGTAEPGATVRVSQVGLGVVGATTATATGHFSFTHANASLVDGAFRYIASATGADGAASAPSQPVMFRPNLVLINLDDMRADELGFMPFVNQQIVSQGTLFTNAFVPTAIWCDYAGGRYEFAHPDI